MARTRGNSRTFIGIDNGVSGSIGVIVVSEIGKLSYFHQMPTFSDLNYTKVKHNITRISTIPLRTLLERHDATSHVVLERPMVNPTRFRATQSALRALEATLVVIESLGMSFSYIDSREWQKLLLPSGTKESPELKEASMQIGCRLFPEHREAIEKQGDADGLLIAEFARRMR